MITPLTKSVRIEVVGRDFDRRGLICRRKKHKEQKVLIALQQALQLVASLISLNGRCLEWQEQ
jgi:putative NIF3 family GTP cyclohydrolase 1 type 2